MNEANNNNRTSPLTTFLTLTLLCVPALSSYLNR